MSSLAELIGDAEFLTSHAVRRGIALPVGTADILLGARTKEAALAIAGPDRDAFYKAMEDVGQAVGKTVADIRAETVRIERMRPLVDGAQRLLGFAAANGRKVDDQLRKPIVAIGATLDGGTPTQDQEQEFLRAYEGLTFALSPITAETLEASSTNLPTFDSLKTKKGWKLLQTWSFGRFFNVAVFLLVLLGSCVALSYYYQGAFSLARYKELQDLVTKLDLDMPAKLETLRAAQEKLAKPDPATIDATRKAASDATVAVAMAKSQYENANDELKSIPSRLSSWATSSCDSPFFVTRFALCSEVERQRAEAEKKQPAAALAAATPVRIESARTVASRLSDVYLPLLLGWLGAHAFILRRMSKDITARTFAKGSGFNHLVRIGLGALAGLASTWLLTPEAISTLLPTQEAAAGAQFKKIPIWGLAFVAGYGIELVFAFMDRIIAAFTTKDPGPAAS